MSSLLDWPNFRPTASWKRNGRRWDGPCPVSGEGKTKAWATPDDNVIGCSIHGDGSGRMSGSTFREHATALGLMVDLGAGAGSSSHREIERWTWTTADGKTREQIRRAGCGRSECERCKGAASWKHWQPTDPPEAGRGDGPLAPKRLIYLPAGVLPVGPGNVYATEGASDADAARGLGLRAIGRNATPSAESLSRLDKAATYRVVPDNDPSGYAQAVKCADAMTAAGLRVELIDPLALNPDAAEKYDLRDWVRSTDTDAAGAAALLDKAVVDVDVIRKRIPAAPARTEPASPAGDADVGDGFIPIARRHVELCASEETAAKAISRRAKGRLACIHQTGEWLVFAAHGWCYVHRTAIEEACADFAQWNIGSTDKKTGEATYSPRSTGRKSVGRAITGLLEPMVGTEFEEWDVTGNIIMLPDGALLDVFTGQQRPGTPADRVRRRVPVAPASEDDYNGSVFRAVLESLIPDAAEREYLQRRLGAALVNAPGMDDLIWLFGPPGAGKGTVLEALAQAFGDYGRGVPAGELIKGRPHNSHPAWVARLAGARILFADDVPAGHALEENAINLLLGSLITANRMRREPFDFRLCAPLIVTSNAEPRQATSNVRRLKPIECSPAASEDPTVRAAMRTAPERAAVVRWLCVGAFHFARIGCTAPESIKARARDVAADAPVAIFTEQFPVGDRFRTGDVWRRWQMFAQEQGCAGLAKNQTALAARLKAHGWTTSKSNGIRYLTAPPPGQGADRVGLLIDYARECRTLYRVNKEHDPARPPEPDEFPAGALGPAAPPVDQGAGGGSQQPGFLESTPPLARVADQQSAAPESAPAPPVETMPSNRTPAPEPAPEREDGSGDQTARGGDQDGTGASDTRPVSGDLRLGDWDPERGRLIGILPADKTCGACGGTGRQGGSDCDRCGGAGLRPEGDTCPRCLGSGKTATGQPCLSCMPLAVFVDPDRHPLPPEELQAATAYVERMRAREATAEANAARTRAWLYGETGDADGYDDDGII